MDEDAVEEGWYDESWTSARRYGNTVDDINAIQINPIIAIVNLYNPSLLFKYSNFH